MNTVIRIEQGDITKCPVDAVVTAANPKLTGGGGVDGAIHRAAGPELLRACLALGGCDTGEAKLTYGYNLPAKFVVHTVGPRYGEMDGLEASYLEDCYKNSLRLADEKRLASVAFPAIATGAYGFPLEEATGIAMESVQEYLEAHPQTSLREIVFVCYSEGDTAVYRSIYRDVFG